MSALEEAARALLALWDEENGGGEPTGELQSLHDEISHGVMLKCMDACKHPGFGRDVADAIARLEEALP